MGPLPTKEQENAKYFENYSLTHGGNLPPESLKPPVAAGSIGIDPDLFTWSSAFMNAAESYRDKGGNPIKLNISAGYRPGAYQKHFVDMAERYKELLYRYKKEVRLASVQPEPTLSPTRTSPINYVNFEGWLNAAKADAVNVPTALDCLDRIGSLMDHAANPAKHGIVIKPLDDFKLAVQPLSRHSDLPANAVDVSGMGDFTIARNQIASFAADFNLIRPYCRSAGCTDRPHFELLVGTCESFCNVDMIPNVLTLYAASPVSILVTDPLGRRVGFDPATNQIINEVGSNAYYTGIGEPQEVTIYGLDEGNYALTATATGTGPYTLGIIQSNEDGEDVSVKTNTGIAAVGVAIPTIMQTVGSSNELPIANPGANRTVRLGSRVALNGLGSSDPDSGPGPLTYSWTKVSGPSVSVAGGSTSNPAFTPTTPGTYTFGLVVNDGQDNSVPVNVNITVPILGDLNLDGKVNVDDLKLLKAARISVANGPNDLRDLNGDGRIDGKDVPELVKRCTGPGCG